MIIIVAIVLIIIWIWYFHFNDPTVEIAQFKDITFNTGDILLFRSNDNMYPIFFGNYFSHVGVVYVDQEGVPMLFEAVNKPEFAGVRCIQLIPFLMNLRGTVHIKQLEKRIDPEIISQFSDFIDHCCETMAYEKRVLSRSIINGLTNTPIQSKLNCGELCFLSLIKLELLPINWYKDNIMFHYLKFVSYIKDVQSNRYLDMKRIVF
jgi:hypothetical protein